MSLISVGMPLYNAEKFVEQALDCLLRQTHTDLEIIISDNCSTDNTVAIVERYAAADTRLKLFRQPENLGPIPNFQFVVEQARGDYFMWRSYDDWSDDNYIETLAAVLDSNRAVDLAVGKVIRANNESQIEGGQELAAYKPTAGFRDSIDMIKASHPGWMYGLFRRAPILATINEVVRDFPHVWGWDHLILFPFASRNRVAGHYGTRFFQRETGISSDRYRPKPAAAQIELARSFYRFCRRDYDKSDASRVQKLAMGIFLLKHTSSCTEKFTRTLRILLGLRRP
ncbi:glycosyltransferase [Sneathiella marina]|uniref:Glycosyltransferase n=1 Tax=Sneathiella marina TaxID=2950108 RepID=A0ABY4W0G7_9PROT|nr:glycosyltransferase family 2 protein [Sneathiella marina]USG60344.1 glycosyltransferase [Sneathiella marina]